MPNWAKGSLKLRGRSENIASALKEMLLNDTVTLEDKPKVPSESPKVEPKKEEVKVENKGEVSHETPVETYKAPMLPQTGSETGVALSVLGLTVLSLTVAFKKKEN